MFSFLRRTKSGRTIASSRASSWKPRLDGLEERCLLSTYSTVVVGDHPAAYYRLGEASGTTAFDSSGNNQSGTYLGGVTLGQSGALAGDSDTSVAFDGVSGIVDTNYKPSDPSFTIEAWIKPTAAIADQSVVAGRGNAAQLNYNAGDTPGYAGIAFWDSAAFDVTLSTAALPLNQWTCLAGTWDNSTKSLSIYENGVLNNTHTFAGKTPVASDPLTTFQIGAFDATLHGGSYKDQYFQGGIDEVAYYSYPITSTQVQQHYKAGTEVPVTITTSTLANWTVNQPGYIQPISAMGGTGSYTFSTTAGTLPTGLSLSTTGVLSGTPTAIGQ